MQGLMKFHPLLLKILRKQNVTDRRTHGWTDGWTDNVKTVYSPTKTACGGYNDHFRSNTDPYYIQNRTCCKEVEVYMFLYIAFNFACTVDVFASV